MNKNKSTGRTLIQAPSNSDEAPGVERTASMAETPSTRVSGGGAGSSEKDKNTTARGVLEGEEAGESREV